MGHEELEIDIDRTGKVTVRTVGIKGARCLKVTEFLTELVGCEESSNVTPEFYEETVISHSVDIRSHQ